MNKIITAEEMAARYAPLLDLHGALKEVERLSAENERLREALQRIAALEDDFESNAAMTAHEWQMFHTARAALGGQQ